MASGWGISFCAMWSVAGLLVHLVDVSGSEGRDPIQDFETINRELERFNPALPNGLCWWREQMRFGCRRAGGAVPRVCCGKRI